jgi:hypothetical protein
MNALFSLHRLVSRALRVLTPSLVCLALAACGGSADAPPPPETGSQATPPTITPQPADISVTAGQAASFTVGATGTAPLSYQWQRGGVDISGANGTTYTLPATVPGDTGDTFRAVVTNAAGSATSNAATLTVLASAPVLTITQQPASIAVVAGTQATFDVAATCSAGTLTVQWQRSQGSGAGLTWADITSASATAYSLATAIGDSGAQFRANLSCSGQSATTSNAATLTVAAPSAVTLSLLPIVGLRDQADVFQTYAIDQDASGSFTFTAAQQVKRLSADLSTVTTLAGGPSNGAADGVGTAARFDNPKGITQDAAGIVYVADTNNHTIRRIALDGTVTTLAGLAGNAGAVDGTGSAARFSQPWGVAIGPDGDLYVAEYANSLIRRVTPAGVVTTYAGSTAGFAEGAATSAQFNRPDGVAVAANGDVLVADSSNQRIRRILRSGNGAGLVETLAGSGAFSSVDGTGTAASIAGPSGMVVRGNTLTVYDATSVLRQIDLTTRVVTTLTGSRILGPGMADGPVGAARIRDIGGVTGAPNGGFLLADFSALRTVSASGTVRTIANSYATGVTPTGIGTLAQMPMTPSGGGVTVDPAGNVVIADSTALTVRRISPAGAVSLASGLVGAINAPLDGVGSEAQLRTPRSIASDALGVLWFIDGYSVRRIGTDNATTVLAGSPDTFGSLDGNAATARFNALFGLTLGPAGDIFVTANLAVRRIDAAGNVSTYAGAIDQGGVRIDGPSATARFQSLGEIAAAPDGTLYVTDGGVIRRISADGSSVTTLAGGLGAYRLAVDSAGTIYYASTFGGLYMLTAGGVQTPLIAGGAAVVLGNVNPTVSTVGGIAVLGPKQLVILSGGQILVVTLP